jgi:hypothetical protein
VIKYTRKKIKRQIYAYFKRMILVTLNEAIALHFMSFNSDKPKIRQTEDRFQRYDFAKRIAHIVALNAAESSLVIGLYGSGAKVKPR